MGGDNSGGIGASVVAIHVHDDEASPAETTGDALDYFSGQPFQDGVDVYMPADADASGTITVTNHPRGDADDPQVLKFPNWPSDKHSVTLYFSDYPQD